MSTSTTTSRDLTGLPIDQRGHRHISRRSGEPPVALQFGSEGEDGAKWFGLDLFGAVFSCELCDAYASWTVVEDSDGNPVSVAAKTECSLPEGITTVIELAVPSGKMIVNDDLRPLYSWSDPERGKPSYNSVAGQALAIEEMAEQGCAYGPVLNSSPSLIRTGDDQYIISHYDSELGPGEDDNPHGEALASVCTDLWAYSIADYDDWLSKLTEWLAQPDADLENSWRMKDLAAWFRSGADPKDLPWTITVVDVTPGVYRFTHHTGEAAFDHDAWPAIFAHVERIR
ncbi:hypothetical protein [Agromyces humi]|uniref:hypothetical protein n=1 Tax=Agromyces humi TaxID=1766800 RepID=UPI0013572507|nr:hypothetical protein [Agromyces humi]